MGLGVTQHLGSIRVRLRAGDLGLQGLSEAMRHEGAFGCCFNSASGWEGRKGVGVGRGNSGLPQQARTWSRSRPLCPVGRPSVREGAALRLPSPQPSHLVGWPHCSWEEQLWSGLSLVTSLPGVGPALSPRLWIRGGSRLGLSLEPQLLSKWCSGAH